MTKLFEPIHIGNHTLQHRVVLAPLTRFRATSEGVPTDLMVEYYSQRTSAGGLLITEAAIINQESIGYPRMPGIYTKEQIQEWKKVANAIHQKGGIAFLQIAHVGRVASSQLSKVTPVSASAISISGKTLNGGDYEVPRALELSEIQERIEAYKQAALAAIEQAGFDGVEIHSANGCLPDQFINTSSNQRKDRYGGSIENRARFVLEVVDAVAAAVGPERTSVRFSPGGTFSDMYDPYPVETWSYITQALQDRQPRLAYVHFTEPRSDANSEIENKVDSLDVFREIWKGPFMSAGGYSTVVDHALDLAESTGNLIAFGRVFIANPDLPERIKRGLSLNKYDRSTFYTNDAVGYTDYPFYTEEIDSRL
ncbi:hypothetical protein G6F56_005812 [Rhizopus delemar]|nr:hypothetical protein G6F56_005812 [Rhizopus delemar]